MVTITAKCEWCGGEKKFEWNFVEWAIKFDKESLAALFESNGFRIFKYEPYIVECDYGRIRKSPGNITAFICESCHKKFIETKEKIEDDWMGGIRKLIEGFSN